MLRFMLTRRRFLEVVAGATAGATLASCVPVQPGVAPSEAPPAAPKAAEAVAIRHWHIWGGPPYTTWHEEALKQFKELRPEITVETTYVGGAGYDEKVNTAIAGGEPPDVLDTTGSPRFGFRKMLIDLTPLFDASAVISKSDFPAYQIIRCSWGAETYAVPREADCNAIFWWNKDIYAEVGLDPEKPPETWDELLDVAEKTTKVGDDGVMTRIGFMPTYSQSWFYVYLWLTGGELTEPEPPGPDVHTKAIFNEPRGEAALDIMVRLSDIVGGAEVMSSFQQGFQSGAQAPFYAGQLAMMVTGDWTFGPIKEYAPDLNYGITHMPLPPNGKIVTSSGGWAFSIPTGAKTEPAWAYTEYMTSAETSLWRAKATLKLPAHLKIANDPFFSENPQLKLAVDLVSQHGHGFPEAPWVGQMWNRVNVEMRDEAIFHKKTVQQALADAADDTQGYIDAVYAAMEQ